MHDPLVELDPNNIPLYRKGGNGKEAVPIHIFGYVPTDQELLAYVNKFNINPNQTNEERRVSAARQSIMDLLPLEMIQRHAVVPVKDESEGWAICSAVIATNLCQEELDIAKDRMLIEGLKTVYSTEEEPKWYKLDRNDALEYSSRW